MSDIPSYRLTMRFPFSNITTHGGYIRVLLIVNKRITRILFETSKEVSRKFTVYYRPRTLAVEDILRRLEWNKILNQESSIKD